MEDKSIILGDLVLTVDEINMIMTGDIVCTFHLSHRAEPNESLVELVGEVTGDQLEVMCKTKLTARRFEIFSRFLFMYEKNIVRYFQMLTEGTTPVMFRDT
ncbi:MAG: hypothetical protein AAF462_00935 [Thermodesulfobacteriota bacterium]